MFSGGVVRSFYDGFACGQLNQEDISRCVSMFFKLAYFSDKMRARNRFRGNWGVSTIIQTTLEKQQTPLGGSREIVGGIPKKGDPFA